MTFFLHALSFLPSSLHFLSLRLVSKHPYTATDKMVKSDDQVIEEWKGVFPVSPPPSLSSSSLTPHLLQSS